MSLQSKLQEWASETGFEDTLPSKKELESVLSNVHLFIRDLAKEVLRKYEQKTGNKFRLSEDQLADQFRLNADDDEGLFLETAIKYTETLTQTFDLYRKEMKTRGYPYRDHRIPKVTAYCFAILEVVPYYTHDIDELLADEDNHPDFIKSIKETFAKMEKLALKSQERFYQCLDEEVFITEIKQDLRS